MQLIHGIHDGSAGAGPLNLTDPSRAHQGSSRGVEGGVEAAGHLVADRDEQSPTEQPQDQGEQARVPQRQLAPQAGQGPHGCVAPKR